MGTWRAKRAEGVLTKAGSINTRPHNATLCR